MAKKNLSKNIVISFEIYNADPLSHTPMPSLSFRASNYNLSMDEILRAKLRPNKLTLDNKVAYVKFDENAFFNRDGENILKVDYKKIEAKEPYKTAFP